MGSVELELGCGGHQTNPVMAATNLILTLTVALLIVSTALCGPVKRSADAMSLADGDAEPINAMYGFYGQPLYRPYGFGAFGYGSVNYGLARTIVPGHYGGFYNYYN